jgi:hypothetical protein
MGVASFAPYVDAPVPHGGGQSLDEKLNRSLLAVLSNTWFGDFAN